MRHFVLAALVLWSIGAAALAQPQPGSLLLTFLQRTGTMATGGFTAVVDPGNLGSWSTLVSAPRNRWHNWVRMAADNTDLMIAEGDLQTVRSRLVQSDPSGNVSPASPNVPSRINVFALDHDGRWIAAASGNNASMLYALQSESSQQLFVDVSPGSYNGMAIDRDLGGPIYVIAMHHANTVSGVTRKILGANRSGVVTTIVQHVGNPLMGLSGIELHPRTGKYLTTDFHGPTNGDPQGAEVNLVAKDGSVVTPVTTYIGANGARIGQDDTLWIVGLSSGTNSVLRYDLTKNTVVMLARLTSIPSGTVVTGIEIYGSRPLACERKEATATVRVQSRNPAAANAVYVLAASFARRPGYRFGNGEYLDLDITDPLFLLTATNKLPTIFQGFQGLLNGRGDATATVAVPAPLAGSGITIFVAGVVLNASGLVEVTNTHWIVM